MVYNETIFWRTLSKGGSALDEQRGGAARTISLVMLITLIGKVLGLYRDRLLAIHYSVGPEASAFFYGQPHPPGVF